MQKSITSQEYLKTNQVLTIALTFGTALFIIVGFYLQISGAMTLYSAENQSIPFAFIFPICSIIMITASFVVSSKFIQKAISLPTFGEKLSRYRVAVLIRFAMLEGAAILLVLGYWFTNQSFMLGAAVAIVSIMGMFIQRKEIMLRELQLEGEEERKMQTPDAVVMTQEMGE